MCRRSCSTSYGLAAAPQVIVYGLQAPRIIAMQSNSPAAQQLLPRFFRLAARCLHHHASLYAVSVVLTAAGCALQARFQSLNPGFMGASYVQDTIWCVKDEILFMVAQWDRADQLERYDLSKWATPELHPSVVPELVTREPSSCRLCQGEEPVSWRVGQAWSSTRHGA